MQKSQLRDQAKSLLIHYIEKAIGNIDPEEVGSIVDIIVDAVHEEIDSKVRTVNHVEVGDMSPK